MKLPLLLASAATLAITVSPAWAQEVDDHHAPEEIVVTGTLIRARQDVLSGVAVIQSQELAQALRPSIGETLQNIPGVSATSFGPSASRPVLRGLQGERVRVLTDGIGAIDVSNTSVDHAVVVNPLLAERIEVLRGPQSLLYGASAIGGVVNVTDRRLPTKVPSEKVHIGAIASYGSAANERSLSASTDVLIAENLVFHADGSWSKSDDLRIGGYALSPALRAQAHASSLLPPDPDSDIDFAGNAALAGTLPNTSARAWTAGLGMTYVNDGGAIGVAYSHTDNIYGIPVRFATLPGQGQEAPRIALKQDRIDGRAEINTDGSLISKLAFRVGYADYQHAEIEPDGTVGTTFYNKGVEARFELAQADRGGWKGVTGAQMVIRDFDVVGDEAFLPKNSSAQVGFFTLQQYETGPWNLEAGARFERSRISSKPLPAQSQFYNGRLSFDTFSAALGAMYEITPQWKFGVNLSRTARAPAAEELLANGPHAGTESYEVGDPGLKPERVWSAEAILRGHGERFSFETSVYHSWFSNFIYDNRTGAVVDGLPEYRLQQANARFYGFEVQGDYTLAEFGDWKLKAEALADYVHADIDSFGPAPRIPPLRLKGGFELSSWKWDFKANVERVTGQDRVAPNEDPTPGYTLANVEVSWRPWGRDKPLSVLLSANNLFDVNARRHASFLKDYAPLAGRDVRATLRLEI
jgi:iron complex outermembrane receptor protein